MTVGEALVDLISADTGPELVDCSRFDAVVGGAPANVAITAARLGGRVAAYSRVGVDPFGDKLERAMVEAGVTSQLARDGDLPTTVAVVHRSDSTPEFFIMRGADANSTVGPIPPTRWVHTSMFALSREPQRSAILTLLDNLPPETSVSLDCNYHRSVWGSLDPRPTLALLGKSVDFLKLSLDDAERMFSFHGRTVIMEELAEMGFGQVCLTGGSQEIWLSVSGDLIRVPVPSREVVDVTGAGDAFIAGMVLATIDGLSSEDAVRVGIEVAGQSLAVVGHLPQPIDRRALYPTS